MKVELEIGSPGADALFTETIKQSMKNCQEVGDDPNYTKMYLSACLIVLRHFGVND